MDLSCSLDLLGVQLVARGFTISFDGFGRLVRKSEKHLCTQNKLWESFYLCTLSVFMTHAVQVSMWPCLLPGELPAREITMTAEIVDGLLRSNTARPGLRQGILVVTLGAADGNPMAFSPEVSAQSGAQALLPPSRASRLSPFCGCPLLSSSQVFNDVGSGEVQEPLTHIQVSASSGSTTVLHISSQFEAQGALS